MSQQGMIVAGVMSGTSADGIDVALVRISESELNSRARGEPAIQLLGHATYSYSPRVRRAILSAMNASSARVADLARLNFLLGELYAKAVLATQARFRVKAELVGCHGQTIYHQGEARNFLGRRISTTWQTGEGAIIASRVAVPVVSDFRPADMAVGGKGAPLVPYLDYLWFRDARTGRIVQNIGGIANLTAIPAGARPQDIIAFDTGPGNMLIDATTQLLFGRPYDRNGAIAREGAVLLNVLASAIRHPFFRRKPPKSAGREQFGSAFAADFIASCKSASPRAEDAVATATALTASSIRTAYQRFVLPLMGRAQVDYLLSGGGAKNETLAAMIEHELSPLGCRVGITDNLGLPAQAKEAVAFALLSYETWHRRPGNVPSATGARRPAILGDITYA